MARKEPTRGSGDKYGRRENDELVKMYQGMSENQKMYHTTQTAEENQDTPCFDDFVKSPSDRNYPTQFETTIDGNSRGVPQFKTMGHSLDAPDSKVTGMNYGSHDDARTPDYRATGSQSGHKGPMMKEHSLADMNQMMKWSTSQIGSYVSGGPGGGAIGKSDKGING